MTRFNTKRMLAAENMAFGMKMMFVQSQTRLLSVGFRQILSDRTETVRTDRKCPIGQKLSEWTESVRIERKPSDQTETVRTDRNRPIEQNLSVNRVNCPGSEVRISSFSKPIPGITYNRSYFQTVFVRSDENCPIGRKQSDRTESVRSDSFRRIG